MTNILTTETGRYVVQVYVGALSQHYEALSVEASKQTSSEEIVQCIVERLQLGNTINYELAEVVGDECGQECKERRLGPTECPVACMLLWPKDTDSTEDRYRFYLREKLNDNIWADGFNIDPELIRDYFYRFLYQPQDREAYLYVCWLNLDCCQSFHPIYNPKYVKLYQNRRIGPDLPPHIFAIADSAYQRMLRSKRNQCIVISGESGSGKTESTNFLLHHLTALSQKGSHGSGVEQTILSAGPVLEAFGNAKTAHNNNSSRFGKFIQVNYKENGMVHGAVVQKYLLEKSRICSQGRGERNYHVFYYLLAGASDQDRHSLHLKKIESYHYLNRSGPYTLDNVDEKYEFSRLQQSMEMVGFTQEKQRRNVEFVPRKSAYHHDESVTVRNTEVVVLISELLRVKKETLLAALTAKHARASDETLVINYRLPEAIAARDAMAKCLYGALFDWIVMQVNHALLSKKDTLRAHQGNSIGVLDIFGFEDFGLSNSFEQLCINYANEHLQYYFNQHVFQYEQEEYNKEGIRWRHIEFSDNTLCLQLVEGKPNGLLCVLDDQANFPGASNETLLQKFNTVHRDNPFYEIPQRRENAFIVKHYAGKVKYQVAEMREKNLDLMRDGTKNPVSQWCKTYAQKDNYNRIYSSKTPPTKQTAGATASPANSGSPSSPSSGAGRGAPTASSGSPASSTSAGEGRGAPTAGDTSKVTADIMRRTRALYPQEAKVFERATQIVKKNKSFRPREKGPKGLKNLQSVKTLAGRISVGGVTSAGGQGGSGKRKQPLTVTAQFQQSLHCLMNTLNQANPFFIRCIKSNTMKIPNNFDIDTVQRQLRYTGMLETVRIRQAGYNVRLSYDEFIQFSPSDVREFLLTLNLNRDNYQIGTSKIFLRESEKLRLDFRLHQQIMGSIVAIQKGVRAYIERKRFCRLKEAAITIQRWWRAVLERRCLRSHLAASTIQRVWRSYRARAWVRSLRDNLVQFQAHARGYLLRRDMKNKKRKASKTPTESEVEVESEGKGDASSVHSESISDHINHTHDRSGLPPSSHSTSGSPPSDLPSLPLPARRQNSQDTTSSGHRTQDLSELSLRAMSIDTDVDDLDEKLAVDMFTDEKLAQDLMEDLVGDPQTILSPSKTHPPDSIAPSSSGPVTTPTTPPTPSLNKTDSPSKTEVLTKVTYRKAKRHSRTFIRNHDTKSSSSSPPSPLSKLGGEEDEYSDGLDDVNDLDSDEYEDETSSTRTVFRRRSTNTTTVSSTSLDGEPPKATTTNGLPSADTGPTVPSKKYLARAVPVSSHQPTAPVRVARRQREYTRTDERTLVYARLSDAGDNADCDNALDNAVHSRTSLSDNSHSTGSELLKRRNSDTSSVQSSRPGFDSHQSELVKKPVRISMSSDFGPSTPGSTKVTSPGPMITIAGHTFHELPASGLKAGNAAGGAGVTSSNSNTKPERCKYCDKSLDLKSLGGAQRCAYCNECFHTRCIQSGGVVILPCQRSLLHSNTSSTLISGGAPLGRNRKLMRKAPSSSTSALSSPHYYEKSMTTASPASVEGKFNLTGTSEFTDSTDKIISDAKELQLMHDFITQKISLLF
ncbi:hypothetical protein M8J76_010115 [Diaphorina citri]|nr:hypothetical protein M8J76_010115 [Diaphorina citri]